MATLAISADTAKATANIKKLSEMMDRTFKKMKDKGEISEATYKKLTKATGKQKQAMGELSTKVRRAETNFKKMNRTGKAFNSTMNKGTGILKKFGPAIAGIASVATVTRLSTMAAESVALTDKIGDLSDAIGVSVEEFYAFSKVAQTVQIDAQGASDFLSDLAEKVQETALQGGFLLDNWLALGIGTRQTFQEMANMNAIEMFDNLLKKSEEANLSFNEMLLLFKEISGTEGQRIAGLLKTHGIAGTRRLIVEAQGGLTTGQVAEARRITDRWTTLKNDWADMWRGPALNAANLLLDGAEKFITAFGIVGDLIKEGGLVDQRAARMRREGHFTGGVTLDDELPPERIEPQLPQFAKDLIELSEVAADRAAMNRALAMYRETGSLDTPTINAIEALGNSRFDIDSGRLGRQIFRGSGSDLWGPIATQPIAGGGKGVHVDVEKARDALIRQREEEAAADEKAALAAQRLAERNKELDSSYKRMLASLDPLYEVQLRHEEQMTKLKEIRDAGVITAEQFSVMEGKLEKARKDSLDALDENLQKTKAMTQQMASDITGTLKGILQGTMSLRDGVKNIMHDMATRMLDRFLFQPLQNSIANALGGLFGLGGGGGLLSGLFGGFFAEGGQVSPGRFHVVGERGPELFAPSNRGRIVPNSQLGGTTVHVQDINISVVSEPGQDAEDQGETIANTILSVVNDAGQRGRI